MNEPGRTPTDKDIKYGVNPLHRCYYRMQKGTIVHEKDKQGRLTRRQWEERCHCGRFKSTDCKFDVTESKLPTRTVRWFNTSGELDRVTGDIP